MKTSFSVLVAVLAGTFLVQFVSGEVQATEARSGLAAASNKVVHAEMRSIVRSAGSKDTKAAEGSKGLAFPAKQLQSVSFAHGAEQMKQELSPAFQVSSDPRDEVQLSVRDGIVTVRGSVGSEAVAQKVIKEFARTSGVREVRNELTVRTNHDAQIAAELRGELSQDEITHVGGIAVTVCAGIVFLSGEVLSEEESARAEELAAKLPGVTRVSNGLRVPTGGRNPARAASGARTLSRTR